MQRTPLITHHQACDAKLVDFAGWEMPIQYTGVVDEYQTVRSHVGLFDVSHMGRLRVAGPGALPFLQRVTTNDVGKLTVSQAHYSMVCNEQGGIKDDIFVYRLASEEFLLCVNASNREKILSWLQAQLGQDKTVRLEDRSVELAQVAIQGPKSRDLLTSLGVTGLEGLKLHHTCDGTLDGLACLCARTGYTGELGYEIYIDADKVGRLWNLLIDKGTAWGLKPAGLGARDLLRLEMGYLLYGNDMDETVNPLDAGMAWTVDLDSDRDFIGRAALEAKGQSKAFVGLKLLDKGVMRSHMRVMTAQGEGVTTSGTFSPTLGFSIALARVPMAVAAGDKVQIEIRGKLMDALVTKPSFVRNGKALV